MQIKKQCTVFLNRSTTNGAYILWQSTKLDCIELIFLTKAFRCYTYSFSSFCLLHYSFYNSCIKVWHKLTFKKVKMGSNPIQWANALATLMAVLYTGTPFFLSLNLVPSLKGSN